MRYDVTVLAFCLGTTALAQDSLPNFTPAPCPHINIPADGNILLAAAWRFLTAMAIYCRTSTRPAAAARRS